MFNSFAQPKQRLNANEHKDSIKPLLSAQAFCVWTYFFSKDPLENEIIVKIDPRKNSNARCSECGTTSPIYDTLKKPRRFEFIPMWGYLIFFLYCPRRVSCKKCKKVKVEELPWANKGSSITKPYKVYLAMWAKRMSWKETAEAFQSTWYHVYESVKSVVEYGLENRSLKGVEAIGVDEVQWRKGHDYMTLVYQIDQGARRLLHVSEKRRVKSLLKFFRMIGEKRSTQIKYVCSDMWKPYLKVIKKKIPNALHILDRFHIVANLNKALNEVRASEARKMRDEGYQDILKNSKYCFLKNAENRTQKQKLKLKDILEYDLKSVRAFLLKESFQLFWNYSSPYWAAWYLDIWCKRAMRSRLEPFKKFAKSMRRHQPLILNYFKAKKQFSSGVVEGLNRKVNLTTRKAYGFKTFKNLEIALYHRMGELPEPKSTHCFF